MGEDVIHSQMSVSLPPRVTKLGAHLLACGCSAESELPVAPRPMEMHMIDLRGSSQGEAQ